MRSHCTGLFLWLLVAAGCDRANTESSFAEVELSELSEVAPTVDFSGVRDLVVTGDELWVLDGAPPFLTRISPGGVHQFGPEGPGPKELRNPWALQPTGDSTGGVRVWDLGNRRVVQFAASDTQLGYARLSETGRSRVRANIRQVSYANPFRIRTWGDGVVFSQFSRGVDRTADMTSGALVAAADNLEPTAQLLTFADHIPRSAQSLREWASVPIWDACDGTLAVWSPEQEQVLWLSSTGEVESTTSVALERHAITPRDVEGYLRWMGRLELGAGYESQGVDYAQLARQNIDRFASTAPLVTDVRCESRDVVWLRLFDTLSSPLGRGRSWVRMDRTGYVRGFRLPAGFEAFVFIQGSALGLLTPPDQFQQLARWAPDIGDSLEALPQIPPKEH